MRGSQHTGSCICRQGRKLAVPNMLLQQSSSAFSTASAVDAAANGLMQVAMADIVLLPLGGAAHKAGQHLAS